MYLDSFLKIAKLEDADITDTLKQLEQISRTFGITFTISVSMDKEQIPEAFQESILIAL